jgi:hypothetical protein
MAQLSRLHWADPGADPGGRGHTHSYCHTSHFPRRPPYTAFFRAAGQHPHAP